MERGNEVVVGFSAMPQAIRWNVHSHDGALVEAHLEGKDASLEYRFAAPYDGDFFPTWENPGDSSQTITARLEGDRIVSRY